MLRHNKKKWWKTRRDWVWIVNKNATSYLFQTSSHLDQCLLRQIYLQTEYQPSLIYVQMWFTCLGPESAESAHDVMTSHAYCGASACRREPHQVETTGSKWNQRWNDSWVACMHDGGIWVRSWLHHYVWDSGKLIRTGPYNRRHNCFRGWARHTWAYPCPYPFHVVKNSFHYLNLLFLYGRYIFCDRCIEWCMR